MRLAIDLSLGGARGGGALGSHGLTVGNLGVSWGMFNSGATGELTPREIDGVAVTDLNSATTTTFTQLRFAGGVQPNGATTYELSVPGFGLVTLPWDGSKYSANVPGFADYLVAQGEGADVPLTPTALTAPTTVNLSDTTIAEDAEVGDLVGIISADGVPAPTYDITSDPDNKFQVNGNRLELAAPVTFPATHNVTLRATNSEGNATQAFAINVTEVPVAPSNYVLSNNTVAQGSPIGTTVGTLTADGTDPKTWAQLEPVNPLYGVVAATGVVETTALVPDLGTSSITVNAINAAGPGPNTPFDITVVEASAEDDKVSSLTINANGWQAQANVLAAVPGATYSGLDNFGASGIALTVSSKSPTKADPNNRITRMVIATSVLRKPYNNGTQLEENTSGANLNVEFSLSSRIHPDDQITGSNVIAGFFTDTAGGGESNSGGSIATVTNSSTLAHYQPQACWMTPPEERIDSATWAPRLFVMHRFAQQGTPVRAVEFIATGETSGVIVTSLVTDLTTGSFSASGLFANWYEPVWNLSGMTDGEKVKINAKIYPWVGEVYDIETQAETYPSAFLCVLKGWCDAGGTARKVYATVDNVGAGTPQVSTDPAVADANPFASMWDAAGAIRDFGSVGNTSGGIIRIPANTEVQCTPLNSFPEGDIGIVIEGVDRATSSVFTSDDAIQYKTKFRNLTLKREAGAGNVRIGFRGRNNSQLSQIVCEDVTFDQNGEGSYTGWWYQVGRQYFINCDGDSCGQGHGGSSSWVQCNALVVGNSGWSGASSPYSQIATDAATWTPANQLNTAYGTPLGPVCAFNRLSHSGATSRGVSLAGSHGPRGFAVVGNILEAHGVQNTMNMYLTADNDNAECLNGMEAHNTIVGERTNIAYQNQVATFNLKDVVSKHSLHWQWNCKSDYWASNAVAILNWAIRHNVDGGHNLIQSDSGALTSGSYTSWLSEAMGDDKTANNVSSLTTVANQSTWGFVNDQSNTRTGSHVAGGTGGGDYTPAAVTIIPQIPAGQTMFKTDLFGRTVPTDGTAYAGAVQKV